MESQAWPRCKWETWCSLTTPTARCWLPFRLLNALDSDRELFDAELDLTKTKRDELLSLVQLYKALGGGWQ